MAKIENDHAFITRLLTQGQGPMNSDEARQLINIIKRKSSFPLISRTSRTSQ